MSKDRSERKMYRKSPGRQYGYEHDPLRSRAAASTQDEQWSPNEEPKGRTTTQLLQRPNPRRTRQLLRQNILAGKAQLVFEDEEGSGFQEDESYAPGAPYEEQHDSTLYSSRYARRSGLLAAPSTRQLMETDEGEEQEEQYEGNSEDEGEWQDFQEVDSDGAYKDPNPVEIQDMHDYAHVPAASRHIQANPPLVTRSSGLPIRTRRLIEPQEYDDDEYDEYEEDDPAPTRRSRKRKVSRRKLLAGFGVAAIAGTGIAAIELGPKIPQAVGSATTNIEHQLEGAFNKGVAQGADAARRELLTALDDLEGFTLAGATTAAQLTRTAYDVFVSPIVKVGAAITGDFLGTILGAVKTARSWLRGAYLDNGTLQALQTILESWTSQVQSMPKQLDAITNTDLDGAQGYLRALQDKIAAEKAKLNNSSSQTTKTTPTPTTKAK